MRTPRTRAVLILISLIALAVVGAAAALVATHHSGSKRGSATVTRAATTTTSTAPVTGPAPTLVPSSIDATGKADVTTALNAFLARVPDGGAVAFPAKGRYRIEGTLTLQNRRNFVVDGNGATFFAKTNGLHHGAAGCNKQASVCRYPNRTRAQWAFIDDTNLVVREVNVIGSDTDAGPNGTYDAAFEAQHAFMILGGARIVLDHVSARDVWGDLVNIGLAQTGSQTASPTNVTVENSVFHSASRQGWSITNGQHVTFVNNSVSSARRSLIDVEANSSHDRIAYVTIRNNRFGSYRLCTFTNYGAPAIEHDFVIADNHAIGSTPIKICVQASRSARRSGWVISGNVGSTDATGPNEPMVSMAFVDRVTVTRNTQRFSAVVWPHRGGVNGSPQAPVTWTCSTVVVTANDFTPRPPGMPEFVGKPC